MKEVKLTVKSEFVDQLRDGAPLLMPYMFTNTKMLQKEGQIILINDERGRFVGRGYYGKENKGIGWLLTNHPKDKLDSEWFKKKINAAISKRKDLLMSKSTNAYRVFNGAAEGIGGLTVDYYDGFYLIQWYSAGVYKFRDNVVNVLKKRKPVRGVYHKKRFGQGGSYIEESAYILGEYPEWPLIVQQDNMKYPVYLDEGAMVGVFLDQREVRKVLHDKYANGKRVLNTFSYTGAFSVAAALGGATETVSVDLANRSLERTQEMFRVNGINPEDHQIIVDDVFKYMKRCKRTFDTIILDPPSFARSKKHTFAAEKNYAELVRDALALLENNGVLIASTNCAKFDMDKFKKMVRDGVRQAGSLYKELESYQLPSDYPTHPLYPVGNYLKVMIIKKK